jgi:NAD(P)-dependent dehydrogenase (short-subunit alcohol dehydrogenase family)
MTQWLEGKAAVITGGGNGIGRAVALEMARLGAKVVVADFSKDGADKVVAEIVSKNGVAVANYGNVATAEGAAGIVETATKNFGRLDILVNCAGNFKIRPTVEMTDDEWNSIITVHLTGHFNCTRAAARVMIPQKTGRIINISSPAAGMGLPPHSPSVAYCAAKAGILGLTTANAVEFEPYGITVNAILPSADTKLFPGWTGPIGGLPGTELVDPEYIAPIMAYLATDQAQSITGRYIFARGEDVCVFARPLQVSSAVLLRGRGKWTIEELHRTMSAVVS